MQNTIFSIFLLMLTMVGCGEEQVNIHPYSRDVTLKEFSTAGIDWEFDNGEGLKLHLDDAYLYMEFTHDSALPNVQFFVDSDNNRTTGVEVEAGTDYMVENCHLFKATDANSWGWKEVGRVDCTIEKGHKDSVRVARTRITLNETFAVNTESLDDNWQPHVYSPRKSPDDVLAPKSLYTRN